MMIQRAVRPSPTRAVECVLCGLARPNTSLAPPDIAQVPSLEQIGDNQHREGEKQQDRRDRGSRRIVVFLEPDEGEQRRDLGIVSAGCRR